MSIQIPNLHTSNQTRASVERAVVVLTARKDASHSGQFIVNGDLRFLSSDAYPTGSLSIRTDLSDSAKGVVTIKTVEQLDTTGKHTPTLFSTGRCSVDLDKKAVGCRYWLMLVDNRAAAGGTPDVIGFLIYDRNGKRVAYGTGPVVTGSVTVAPSSD